MSEDKEWTTVEMLTMISRARLAKGDTPNRITAELRQLLPYQVLEEFHRAVVFLDSRGILTYNERRDLHDYAREYLRA